MRRVRRIDDIGVDDVAHALLLDALEHPLGACALDQHIDARIFGLERCRDLLRDFDVDGRVETDLAFLARGLDEFRRDRARLRQREGAWRRQSEQGGDDRERCCTLMSQVSLPNIL